MRRSIGLVAAALLAACGGSSSGGGSATTLSCTFAGDTCDQVNGTFTAANVELVRSECTTAGGIFAVGACSTTAAVPGYCFYADFQATTGVPIAGASMSDYYYTPAWTPTTAEANCGGTWTGGGAVCGDNTATGSEVCDGTDLNAQTCATQGFTGGTLTCAADCLSLDTSACTGGGSTTIRCLFAGDICIQFTGAMTAADLSSLSADCTGVGASYAIGACSTTGSVPGYCSATGPAPVSGATLAAQTHYYTPAWDSASATSDCGAPLDGTGAVCGDTTISGSEVCDGANLNGQTCSTQGFTGGTLTCAANCYGFVTSGCTGASFNPTNVTESEPNGSIATADGTYSTDHLISGAISPAGDLDYFAVRNTTAGAISVRLETSIGGVGYCSTAYDTLITVVDSAGSPIASDDDAGVNLCSRLIRSIPAGTTYYVIVEELWGDPIPSYQLQVDFP